MERLHAHLEEFLVEYCEDLPEYIPCLPKPPSPMDFLNDYVYTNLPFIINYKEPPFPAIGLWNEKEYLRQKMENKKVTVAVTPNGRADADVDDLFMLPEEREMEFTKFLDELRYPRLNQVFYLQKQNNNLIEEFSPVTPDIDTHITWATEAFGSEPEAVNIWIGDNRSVSSMHKDHYENLYYVIVGKKKFDLYPPVASSWMPYKKYKKYQWYYEDNQWKMKDLNQEIKWISSDKKPETRKKFLLYCKTKSFCVELEPGQCLFIPALWYHEVSQSKFCIAVNYWYNMKFDSKYPFLRLYENLCNLPILSINAAVDIQTELEESLCNELRKKASIKRNKKEVPKKIIKK